MTDRSEPWELQDGWETEVAGAVLRYPLAPRDARRILEIAGRLAGMNIDTDTILRAMMSIGFSEQTWKKLKAPYPWETP